MPNQLKLVEIDEEKEEATQRVLQVLEEWGAESKFIWFREIHRVTDIDKGLLRNVLNELKKSKEVTEYRNDTKRIFFCLKKYFKRCRDVEKRFKGKQVRLKDGSNLKVYQKESKTSERTRKRLEKQKQRRQAKILTKSKSRAKIKKHSRPHKS